jgi:hypothetical protein
MFVELALDSNKYAIRIAKAHKKKADIYGRGYVLLLSLGTPSFKMVGEVLSAAAILLIFISY